MKLQDIAQFNPATKLMRDEDVHFVDMASLPVMARDITKIERRPAASGGAKFINGDTLMARITPCLENGKGALVSGLPGDTSGQGSTEFIVLRAHDSSDEKFIYYVTRNPSFHQYAIQRMTGTSGRQRVSWQSLVDYEMTSLSTAERYQIGEILGSLDDKIELNHNMNETLEAQSHALFRDWFVDFGPVKAKMAGDDPYLAPELWSLFPDRLDNNGSPDGWSICQVRDVMGLAYGKSLPARNRNHGSVPVYGSGGIGGYHNAALINGPTVMVGRKGTVGSLYWENGPSFPIDTVFYVEPKVSLEYCYQLLLSYPLRDMNTDAAVPGLNRENVYRLEFRKPSDQLLDAFNAIASDIRAKMVANLDESRTLAQVRDLLLPKLMSGEIRISAEELIDEAT